ncbi:MAG: Uma2 family endonuclease [Anaerolineae bacterium]|nr:Uma2 family endonuclease [Anaerolineae bacterium]
MATTATRVGMPLDEFLERGSREKFELINGEVRVPNVFGHEEALVTTLTTLFDYLQASDRRGFVRSRLTYTVLDQHDPGWVLGSRTPDVVYYTQERIEHYRATTPDYGSRPLALVPDLVVEVISPNDRFVEFAEKIDAYLADGVRVIWVVNPWQRSITLHAPDLENPVVLKGGAVLDGGDVLPGFRLPLEDLFKAQ